MLAQGNEGAKHGCVGRPPMCLVQCRLMNRHGQAQEGEDRPKNSVPVSSAGWRAVRAVHDVRPTGGVHRCCRPDQPVGLVQNLRQEKAAVNFVRH